jgi:hypothetical protein
MQSPRILRRGVLARLWPLLSDGGLPEANRLRHIMKGAPFCEPTGAETFE